MESKGAQPYIYMCPWSPKGREWFLSLYFLFQASQVALVVKHQPANAGDARDVGSILGSGRFPEGGNSNPLQYSCLENSMDRGVWQDTVHGFAQSQAHTHLSTLLPGSLALCWETLAWIKFSLDNLNLASIFTLLYVVSYDLICLLGEYIVRYPS